MSSARTAGGTNHSPSSPPPPPRAAVGRTSADPQAGTRARGTMSAGGGRGRASQAGGCGRALRVLPPPRDDPVTLCPATVRPHTLLPFSAPPPRVLLAGQRCDTPSLLRTPPTRTAGVKYLGNFAAKSCRVQGGAGGKRDPAEASQATDTRPGPPSSGEETVHGSPKQALQVHPVAFLSKSFEIRPFRSL